MKSKMKTKWIKKVDELNKKLKNSSSIIEMMGILEMFKFYIIEEGRTNKEFK